MDADKKKYNKKRTRLVVSGRQSAKQDEKQIPEGPERPTGVEQARRSLLRKIYAGQVAHLE
jgi:hypothetical protein